MNLSMIIYFLFAAISFSFDQMLGNWFSQSMILMVLLITIYHLVRIKALHRKFKVEKESIISAERARIAKDLHDDLGSGLSAINLLSKHLANNINGSMFDFKTEISRISETSANLNRNIREIVWTIEEKDEDLGSVLQYINKFYQGNFSDLSIMFKLEMDTETATYRLRGDLKKQLLLCIKETINNSIKHSGASNILLNVQGNKKGNVLIEIKDDGKGFTNENSENELHNGYGLNNIQHRMHEIGGESSIKTSSLGTVTTLSLPVMT